MSPLTDGMRTVARGLAVLVLNLPSSDLMLFSLFTCYIPHQSSFGNGPTT
jgi:hypothetical protein